MTTVTVACKLPNGLQVDSGGVRVTFNGADHPNAVGGYGLTPGIDKGWYDGWVKEAGNFAPLVTEAIIAHETTAKAASAAKERKKDVRTGLEGLDPSKPAPGIIPTDEMKSELDKLPSDD